eukprot:Opistho-2@83353
MAASRTSCLERPRMMCRSKATASTSRAKMRRPPLSASEEEIKEIKSKECGVDIGASTKKSFATGVFFPLSAEAREKLEKFRDRFISYVQLAIDTEKETLELAVADNTSAADLSSKVPNNSPRYHFFLFKHDFEGERLESHLFIYSCPGYAAKIKERMLYSSCKAPLLSVAESELGIEFVKKLEISEPSELTEDFVMEELHPRKEEAKKGFSRPQRPGKGGRKLVGSKSQENLVDSDAS